MLRPPECPARNLSPARGVIPRTAIRENQQENGVSTAKALAMSLAMALVLTASCTETRGRWENPDRPEETWARDKAACRRAASERAERDFGLDQQRGTRGYSRTRAYTSSMNRYEAEKQEKTLFERCMTRNGYVRVQQKPEPE